MRVHRVAIVLLVFLLLAMPVLAHVPSFPEENTTPEQAVQVPDPVKSWSFYDSLEEDQVKYYRLTMPAGERLRVGTFTPHTGQFTPSVVVMSPSLNTTASVPEGVTVPEGMGATVVEGDRPDTATYEPFTPSANFHTVGFSRPVETETTYVIAVYEPANRTGPVGVTIGYKEVWSLTEYLAVPFNVLRIHIWEGQHPLLVVGPILLTVLAGLGLFRRRWHGEWETTPLRVSLGTAGVLIAGTGANTAVQMGIALAKTGATPAALVTAVFVAVSFVAGVWVIRLALKPDCILTTQRRIGLATTGVFTLLVWAGFILGPAVLIGLAVIPSWVLKD